MDSSTQGDRLGEVRKRRGLTQRELAQAAGVSRSLVQLLERGEIDKVRTEKLRKLAAALHVPTTTLMRAPAADEAPVAVSADWGPVRDALYRPTPQLEEAPTLAGVRDAVDNAMPLFSANRYADLVTILPPLLRDADALDREGRTVRAFLLRMTAWLLVHVGEYEAADVALNKGFNDADDTREAASLARIRCWRLLHTGRLAECWDEGVQWARDTEPRMSSASAAELSAWGWLHLHNSAAASRDARPGDADDTMRLAAAAAARIGAEYTHRHDFLRTFGPVTVAMKRAENFMVDDKPDKVLALAAAIAPDAPAATRNNRNRHLLDVASSHARIRAYDAAMDVLEGLRADSPLWLKRQREAGYVMDTIISRRRTLTPQMMELADAVALPL